ncbi:unnamed protein product [Rhodiola kirilowii]
MIISFKSQILNFSPFSSSRTKTLKHSQPHPPNPCPPLLSAPLAASPLLASPSPLLLFPRPPLSAITRLSPSYPPPMLADSVSLVGSEGCGAAGGLVGCWCLTVGGWFAGCEGSVEACGGLEF